MNEPAPPKLPVSLAANPKLSSWLKFSADGQVVVSPGKVEIGQGIVTALAQIAAVELDIDLSRIRMPRASTASSPNEGVTSGSLSIQQSGRALRHVCAEVRRIFLEKASDRLGTDIDALGIEDGAIKGPGNVSTSYWELADEVSLERDATVDAMSLRFARVEERIRQGDDLILRAEQDRVGGGLALRPRARPEDHRTLGAQQWVSRGRRGLAQPGVRGTGARHARLLVQDRARGRNLGLDPR